MGYVPELYSGKLLVKFYDATVLAAISNTDYEGEIKQKGDTVIIRKTPDITIRDDEDGAIMVPDQPTSDTESLLIDKGKRWFFVTTKVQDKQTDLKSYTDAWTTDASEQMKIAIDTDVLGNIYADASAYNCGATAGKKTAGINLGASGSPIVPTKADILEYVAAAGQTLDEQSVPEDGRYMVVPPWFWTMLTLSDLKNASIMGDSQSVLRNGRVGKIAGFEFYKSNLLTSVSDSGKTPFYIYFGTKHALTFASQLVENSNTDNPFGFGRLFKGLQVYGYKVVKPEALGYLYAAAN